MKRTFCFFLSVLLVSGLCGCFSSGNETSAEDRGYRYGYEDGKSDGYKEGYEEGIDRGAMVVLDNLPEDAREDWLHDNRDVIRQYGIDY